MRSMSVTMSGSEQALAKAHYRETVLIDRGYLLVLPMALDLTVTYGIQQERTTSLYARKLCIPFDNYTSSA